MKFNATNNEDAQLNIVKETQKKRVTMMWWKKVDVVRKEDQHCKKKRRILTWNRLMFQTTKGQLLQKKTKPKK
jgi:hypothetical protein